MRLFATFLLLAASLIWVPAARARDPVTISGITEPFQDVTLGLADAGIISQQFFKEGDTVRQGDVILELDNKLETLEASRLKAVMEQNKMVYDSTRMLIDTTKSVSQEELTKAEAEYKVSAADYDIALEKVAHRQLVAPFTGSIAEILLKPGAASAPYQPLVRLVNISRCYFVGHVDGKAAASLQMNEPVAIVLDGGQQVAGTICFISPTVDPASGLARVKAIFENADGHIRPGLAAQLTAN